MTASIHSVDIMGVDVDSISVDVLESSEVGEFVLVHVGGNVNLYVHNDYTLSRGLRTIGRQFHTLAELGRRLADAGHQHRTESRTATLERALAIVTENRRTRQVAEHDAIEFAAAMDRAFGQWNITVTDDEILELNRAFENDDRYVADLYTAADMGQVKRRLVVSDAGSVTSRRMILNSSTPY